MTRRIRRYPAESVTSVSHRELPDAAHQAPTGAADRIWKKVQTYYGLGLHPALALCIRHRGQVILDRAIGHARGNAPSDASDAPVQMATPDTVYNLFSATKSVTAMLVLLLVERGPLRL